MDREQLSFFVEGDRVIGDLYLPADNRPSAAVIVGGPMTSVKEQVTGVYARALAERGIAALAIDHRHYGESGGHPRQYERSSHKIADLQAAAAALAGHRRVDAARIGAAGVCLGVGYALWAAVDNPLIRAVGGVAQAAALVCFVGVEVAFEPFDVAVALEGEDVGGEAVERVAKRLGVRINRMDATQKAKIQEDLFGRYMQVRTHDGEKGGERFIATAGYAFELRAKCDSPPWFSTAAPGHGGQARPAGHQA